MQAMWILNAIPPHDGSFWMPRQGSTVAGGVDTLFDFIYYLSLFCFLLITFLLVFFTLRYRHREGQAHEPAAGHSTALELTWTIIPTVVVLVIFYYGFRGFLDMMVEPPNSYEVLVNGQTWQWEFNYENGQYASDDGYLHIPVNTPIRFVLNSKDVIHSLFMPTFRVKKDVVPGRYNRFWAQATETGTFDIYCAEYCGQNHSQMLSKVVVETPEDFAKFIERIKDWTKTKTPLQAGEMLYHTKGCIQCHSTDGKAGIGPTWKDMYGSQVPIVGQGNVLADENYIRESILYPLAKVHQGFTPQMPSFLGMPDQDIGAIIAFMKSISVNYKGDLSQYKQLVNKNAATTQSTTKPATTRPAGK